MSVAVTVRSLDEARAALAAADGEPCRLHSPPGAAGQHGVGWWLALVRILGEEFPGRPFEAVLDCGDAPGLALAAIRAGVPLVRVEGITPEARAGLADIAGQAGTVLLG